MIVVVDYNLGNHGSIFNMLKKIGAPAVISSSVEDISNADKLILPGVGAFDKGMSNIENLGLFDVLAEKVLKGKTPVLGICLGMQLMTRSSEEGERSGFGWINGENVRFRFDPAQNGLKVPHMGWNTVKVVRDDPLFEGLKESRFYFVHSFHVHCENESDVLTTTPYGHDFVSSFHRDNIWGTQFHPEKSHRYGLQLLKNFVERL